MNYTVRSKVIPMIPGLKQLNVTINWEDLSPLCQKRIIDKLYNWLMDNEATRPSLRKEYQENVMQHLRYSMQDVEKNIARFDLLDFLEW